MHRLAKFSEKPRKIKFEGLIHLFRYIKSNKTFGLKYYDIINDAPVSNLLRQAGIINEDQFIALSYSS